MRKLAILLAAILALAMVSVASAQEPVTVTLNALNNSGVSGTATLTAMGNQTQVVVNLTGEPAGASEPIHIHPGTCANLNPKPAFPLKNVEGGTSTTVVNVSLSTLQSGQFAINAHKSASEISTFVSCGNIPALAQTATSLPKSGGVPIALVGAIGLGLLAVGYSVRRRAS